MKGVKNTIMCFRPGITRPVFVVFHKNKSFSLQLQLYRYIYFFFRKRFCYTLNVGEVSKLNVDHKLNYELFGARVRSRREAKKLTQKDLAAAVGCAVTHISNIENNYTIPSLELMMQLCSKLEVTPDYLLLGIDRPDDGDEWAEIRSKLVLCTKEQRRLFRRFLDLTVEDNCNHPTE